MVPPTPRQGSINLMFNFHGDQQRRLFLNPKTGAVRRRYLLPPHSAISPGAV